MIPELGLHRQVIQAQCWPGQYSVLVGMSAKRLTSTQRSVGGLRSGLLMHENKNDSMSAQLPVSS